MEPARTQVSEETLSCRYQGCSDICREGKELCFWHDPDADKTSKDIAGRLEELVELGRSLRGFQLQRANLEGIRLVRKGADPSVDLSNANLYRANLRGAHLYCVDLRAANLLKADLAEANLNSSNMTGANLLGVRLTGSRIEHVEWGKRLYQEQQLLQRHLSNAEQCRSLYMEGEEVCRGIRQSCEAHGLFDVAGQFFHKEMLLRRKQYPLRSWQRWGSKLVDLLCGYGERPFRVFLFSSVLIVFCALLYGMFGLSMGDDIIRLESRASWAANLSKFMDALYFSAVTFTTLGYGDVTPVGFSRALAAAEAFLGNFTLALFVVVFVKKMTR